MKKVLLSVVSLFLISFVIAQQDTLIGFSFAVDSGQDSLNADIGLSVNLLYAISFETDTPSTQGDITFTNGVYSSSGTDYAATASKWDSCANNKYWMIELKTTDYSDLTLYSAQRSGGASPGPKYFKVQYKVGSSGLWTDVSYGFITVANDWTTGVLDNYLLPSATWDASESVFLRWIALSNENSSGAPVDTAGVSKIDEIYVLGTFITSVEESAFCNNVYPNPCSDILNIDTELPIEKIMLMSLDGRLIKLYENPEQSINLSDVDNGIYILHFISENNANHITRKIILQ